MEIGYTGYFMKELNISLNNRSGLHARPAKKFVNLAKKFTSEISVIYREKQANGKSMISLLTLGAESGAKICIVVSGEDEDTAYSAIKEGIEQDFLED
jgi:phosphotransferase system HPr (HPr) family protein